MSRTQNAAAIFEKVLNSRKLVISTHCDNDNHDESTKLDNLRLTTFSRANLSGTYQV